MEKYIIIGTSLAGKTTLVKHLRSTINSPISELDEELTKLNNGEFPLDVEYKHKVLFPKVLEKILNEKEIIFFTNTWYFSLDDLERAKSLDFKIIQLDVSLETLKSRNSLRIKEGYEDMTQYLEGMVKYQEDIKSSGIVDFTIDGEQSVENVATAFLKIMGSEK